MIETLEDLREFYDTAIDPSVQTSRKVSGNQSRLLFQRSDKISDGKSSSLFQSLALIQDEIQPFIVELGVWNKSLQGAATWAFIQYCHHFGGRYLGIDINRSSIDYAKARFTLEEFENARFVCGDALKLLPIIKKPISLCYFDAWHETREDGSQKHLDAFLQIKVPVRVILIDNVYEDRPHKGTMLIPYLESHGYTVHFMHFENRALLSKHIYEFPNSNPS